MVASLRLSQCFLNHHHYCKVCSVPFCAFHLWTKYSSQTKIVYYLRDNSEGMPSMKTLNWVSWICLSSLCTIGLDYAGNLAEVFFSSMRGDWLTEEKRKKRFFHQKKSNIRFVEGINSNYCFADGCLRTNLSYCLFLQKIINKWIKKIFQTWEQNKSNWGLWAHNDLDFSLQTIKI